MGQLQLSGQHVQRVVAQVGRSLESHGTAEAPLPQLELHVLEQVIGLGVVDVEIRVAGDPERAVAQQLHAREQVSQVPGDDRFQRDEAVLVGQGQKARQDRRHLDPGERRPAARVLDEHGEVQRQVRDVGKGVSRIHCERGQYREHLLAEEFGYPCAARGIEIVDPDERNPFCSERRPQLVFEQRRSITELHGRGRPDPLELLSRGQAVRAGLANPGFDGIEHGGHPHLEELVEIRRVDGHEPDALEKRQLSITRECQDAMVEVQPRQLSIEVALG